MEVESPPFRLTNMESLGSKVFKPLITSFKGGILFLCFAWGGGLVWFSLSTTLSRALIEIDGTIMESENELIFPNQPELRYTHYYSTYTIEPSGGGDRIQYVACNNDNSLARDLPVGTRIEKRKWERTYQVNGEIVDDFDLRGYIDFFCVGAVLLLSGIIYGSYRLYYRCRYGYFP